MNTKTKIYLLTAKHYAFDERYNIQAFASNTEAIELLRQWCLWEMIKREYGDIDGSPIGPLIRCCPSFLAAIVEIEAEDPSFEILVLNAEIKQSQVAMEMRIKQNQEGVL